tara:strand:- start:61 stop:687 length:627 start_codon:yes stop_codon:yes gene_type:complete
VNLYPLFASNVIQTTFDDERSISILEKVYKDYELNDPGQDGAGGTLVSKDIFVLNDHSRVKRSLLKKFEEINQNILKLPVDFSLTTSWFTKSNKNSFSQFHSHKNSFYSGVLYFGKYSKDGKQAPIQFKSPIEDLNSFHVLSSEWNIHNSLVWDVYPEQNMLIFFPSYLKHRIGKHLDDNPRYSLAFNIVPVGSYGSGDSIYSTNWFK